VAPSAVQSRNRPSVAYRRIVVPLVARRESEAAVALAAELAGDRGSTIEAVVVIEVPPELPLEAHMREEEAAAKRTLEEARAIGETRGVTVRTRTLRSRLAGEAIVGEAERAGADLVVLRAARKEPCRPRGRIFGRTVDHVLKHAPCRVMVAAPPPSDEARPPARLT
jgi:basic amino acid/polyamine antiporter, APA family